MELINLMPMLIKIVELDFSWPSFNSGLYWVALRLYGCRNSQWISHWFPTKVQYDSLYHLKKI